MLLWDFMLNQTQFLGNDRNPRQDHSGANDHLRDKATRDTEDVQ